MKNSAFLTVADQKVEFPLIVGTEGEVAIDFRSLREKTGCITYDEGYANTGSCKSAITFIDGEKGILRHRGYAIEDLATRSTFLETAYLIIYGELPDKEKLNSFRESISQSAYLHENIIRKHELFPADSHPMAVFSSLLNSMSCYHKELATNQREQDLANFNQATELLLSKCGTLAALSYRMSKGLPVMYPKRNVGYVENFLHMLFSMPDQPYVPVREVVDALDLIFLLHADHEQNCSTSTVRMVASSGCNLFASVCAGACALWGPLHGGANVAVIEQLIEIETSGDNGTLFMESVKAGKRKLMGFGHRVYKNYDPRAKIIKTACEKLLKALNKKDNLLSIAERLEATALQDAYFIERKLYPNVDFYSGIILRAIGIPLDMFTVIFSIGRMPGWIANWKELAEGGSKIYRPRQIYSGNLLRPYPAID
jgi:citrate synthase